MKKAIKPLLIILGMIIVAVVTVILYDKFTSKPEEAVKGMLNGLKNNDMNMVNTYVNYNDLLNATNVDEEDKENVTSLQANLIDTNNDNIKIILSNFSYEVLTTRVENNDATVTVKITNMDLKDVFSQYFGQYVKIAFANGFSSDDQAKQNNINTDQIKETMDEYLKSLLNKEDKQMFTSTVEINLKKDKGNWKVEPSAELKEAILPGINSVGDYLKNLDEVLNK